MDKLMNAFFDELKSIVASVVREELSNVALTFNRNHDSNTDDELLTTVQVCLLLKISKVTLHSYIKKGKIPRKRIGKRNLFSKREVLKVLNEKGINA